jgi:UDP-N-acetyl-D-galactosamine dehydrogenase
LIFKELKQYGTNVDVYDPWAEHGEVKEEYGIDLVKKIEKQYDAIILAVGHNEFKGLDIMKISNGVKTVIYDTKSFLDRSIVDGRL